MTAASRIGIGVGRIAVPAGPLTPAPALVIAVGDPQPGNRNDTIVYRTSGIDQKLAGRPVMADRSYRGNPEVIAPYRKPTDDSTLPDWKEAALPDSRLASRSALPPPGATSRRR